MEGEEDWGFSLIESAQIYTLLLCIDDWRCYLTRRKDLLILFSYAIEYDTEVGTCRGYTIIRDAADP